MASQQPVAWKKRILIPFWVIRIFLMLVTIIIYAIAIKVIADDNDKNMPAIGAVVVFMLLIIAVLLMDVLSILMFLRDALQPKTFLIFNIIQTSFWFCVLILDFAAIAKGANATGIAFTVFVFLLFLALLIYASISFHRQRQFNKRGHYAPAHNPAVHPYNPHGVPEYTNIPQPAYQQPGAEPYKSSTAHYTETGQQGAVELQTPYTQQPTYEGRSGGRSPRGPGLGIHGNGDLGDGHVHGSAAEYYSGSAVQTKAMV